MIRHAWSLSFLVLLAITSGTLLARPAATDSIPGDDTTRLANALLWKISHDDISQPSFLFGTIHLIDADHYFLPEGTESALDKADRLVFEIDMAEMTDIALQLSLLTKAFMNDGTSLKDLVSAEDYQFIEKHFAEMGMPMFLLDRIKPLFLTVFASPDVDMMSLNSGEMKSYEMEFYDYAQSHDKPTAGLETMEFQLSVFDSIPYAAQAEMLVESLRSAESEDGIFQAMIDLYLAQDIESLYAVVGDDEVGAGPYEDILVKNRNRKWISGIREQMEMGPAFFAVGAGHLGGPDGVIRLLRLEGFTCTPVLEATTGRPARKL